MESNVPRIEFGVSGPSGEEGVLLVAPRNEAMEWDLRHEIASTSRYWIHERQAWWIAAPYVPTLHDIVLRFGGVPQLPDTAATALDTNGGPPSAGPAVPDGSLPWWSALASRLDRLLGTISRVRPRAAPSRMLPADPRKA